MTLGRQLRLLLAVLIAAQVVTALAGIGLLGRMSPAIGRILDENVASVEAVEAMFQVLAMRAPTANDRERFFDALATAEGNVTEPDERPSLRQIRARAGAALDGDAPARAEVLAALANLGRINRDAMGRADQEARRLGSAGRWALAFVALFGLSVIVLSARRTHARFVVPLAELSAVVAGHRAGDDHRRCRPLPDSELGEVLVDVNEILDGAARRGESPRRKAAMLKDAVSFLLDRAERPTILLDAEGAVLATSHGALELMAERGDEILTAVREDAESETIEARTTSSSGLRLVTLRAS